MEKNEAYFARPVSAREAQPDDEAEIIWSDNAEEIARSAGLGVLGNPDHENPKAEDALIVTLLEERRDFYKLRRTVRWTMLSVSALWLTVIAYVVLAAL